MIFFIKFIYAFLPNIFLFFILFNEVFENKNKIKNILFIGISSIIIGMLAQKIAISAIYDSLAITIFRFLGIFGFIIFIPFLLMKKKPIFLYYFLCITTFLFSGAFYIDLVKDFKISEANILNTDLIVNLSFIFLGSLVLFFLIFAIIKLTQNIKNKALVYLVFFVSLILYLLNSTAEILLYFVTNDIIDVTTTIFGFKFNTISFIAKATYFYYLAYYLYLGFLFLFLMIFALNKTVFKNDSSLKLYQIRKNKKILLDEDNWLKSITFSLLIIISFLAYYDLYASKPVTISDAKIININEEGNIVIDLEEVSNGDLFRYAYIASDGKKIRFFLINRFPGQEKVTAVFDACMICGDKGYIKQGDQLICVACNVRIFIPSVGKPGGCNPIPLDFIKEDGKLIITEKEILIGGNYFSEIIPLEVQDVVSGEKLSNIDAIYKYEYLGKIFYFKSEESLEKFRQNPDEYTKDMVKRKYRIQGHESEVEK